MAWFAVIVASCSLESGDESTPPVALTDVVFVDAVALDTRSTDVPPDGGGIPEVTVATDLGVDSTLPDLPPVVTPVKPDAGQAGVCLVREVLTCGESAVGTLSGPPSPIDHGCSLIEGSLESASHGYAVWSATAARVTLRLTADTTAHRSLFVRTLAALEGACDPSRCDAWSPETVLPLSAEELRYLSLSSLLGEDGDYALTVECCTPSCVARACGSDGCGGSCGTCNSGTRCEDVDGGATCAPCTDCTCTPNCPPGACGDDGCGGSCGGCPTLQVCASSSCRTPAALQNDGCSTALDISALPFEYVGTTDSANDDLSPNGPLEAAIVPLPGCLRTEAGGRDAVFRYTASAAAVAVAELHAGTGCAGVSGPGCGPGLLLATRACPFDECDAATDVHTGGPRLRVPLTTGQTIYFVVEGYDAEERGPYRLRVTSEPSL